MKLAHCILSGEDIPSNAHSYDIRLAFLQAERELRQSIAMAGGPDTAAYHKARLHELQLRKEAFEGGRPNFEWAMGSDSEKMTTIHAR